PTRVAPQPVPSPSISAAADDLLLREFLAGAGIGDPHFLPPEQWPALMRTSGELLRGMVQGLMQVLRARAELKSQFRVSVTTMRSVDNNPLKFTPNVDDAIKLILAPTNPGFLPPKQAVSEGFNDIMNHQIAMTAGVQAALAEILRSFDPQLIERTQAEGVMFQKKAKCWEYYVEKYPQLKAVAQEEFFGDAFADAYEKQMLLLNRAAKN
ncbi:type VI secretion system-associated FHA domain protein TagH, partial [Methylomonas rivi]